MCNNRIWQNISTYWQHVHWLALRNKYIKQTHTRSLDVLILSHDLKANKIAVYMLMALVETAISVIYSSVILFRSMFSLFKPTKYRSSLFTDFVYCANIRRGSTLFVCQSHSLHDNIVLNVLKFAFQCLIMSVYGWW